MTPRLSALLLAPVLLFAAPAAGQEEDANLAWRPDYGEALMEGRIRNLPVFVSRHKDE